MTKNSSTLTAPKGKIPPKIVVSAGCMYQGCGGTRRGIWFVRTGFGATSFLNPTYAPKKTRGTDTPNHRTTSVSSVETGTAPDDPTLSNEISITRKHANVKPGTRVAVNKVFSIQSVPLNDLYKRAAAWPPAPPAKTYNMSNAVMSDPRFAGDRKPNSAKVSVSKTMHPNCTPDPMHTENNMGLNDGGRNTSA